MLRRANSWKTGGIPLERRTLWKDAPWKAGKDNGHEFLSAMDRMTWSAPPAQCCGRTEIPEMYFFFQQCWAIFLLTTHSSQCLISSRFFPGSVLIIAAAIIFHVFLTCSMCHVLDTALPRAVLWAGSSMATLSDQWRASAIPKGFWPSSSQSVTDVCGHVAGS